MRIGSWLLTITGCLAITVGLASIKYSQISAAMAMAESFPPGYSVVSTATAESVQWTPIRRLTGTVRAIHFVSIAAESVGRVTALPFAAGEQVPQGAVILQLFNEDVRAQRDALISDLELVKLQLSRVERLKKESLASQDQLDSLLARAQSQQARLAALEAQISRLTIHAPFDGQLGIYRQNVSDLMQAGEVLTTLIGIEDTRWIDFKVPQGVANVAEGDSVRLLDLDNNFIGEAVVIAVAEAYSSGIRAYDVRATIDASQLRHGELVQIEVRTGPRQVTIKVPNQALRWDIDGPHVFVLNAAEAGAFKPYRAALRRVELLDERAGNVFIRGDLADGETVASIGAFKLADGDLVARKDKASQG